MKPYIYSIILFFSITFSFAQTEELVLRKSFEVDENSILNIDVDNVTILFKESNDNRIHFDYSIVFKNKSDELIYKVFKDIDAKVSKDDKTINLVVKNSMYLGELYNLDLSINTYKSYIKEYYNNKKKNEFLYKSKDSILKEIDFSLGSDASDYFKRLKQKFPEKNFGEGSEKFHQKFIISVPKKLRIKIKSLHSKITFDYNLKQSINVSAFKTYFKFKKIFNNQNKFDLIMGIFQTKLLSGGDYTFKDMRKVVIGAVSNSNIKTETSKIKIGEINKNVLITDFNSKFHFYNFSENFTKFNLTGDYSTLNFYKIKENNFSMDVSGFHTVLNMKGIKTTFGTSKEEKITKILEKKKKENIPFLGNIEVELKNGILNLK